MSMVFFQKVVDGVNVQAWVPTGKLDEPKVYLDVINGSNGVGVHLQPDVAMTLGRALIKAGKKAEARQLYG